MLLKGISAIAIIVTVCLWCFGLLPGILWIPLSLILSFAIMLILWALSCFICTRFVNTDQPCQRQRWIFRFYVDCILENLQILFRVKLHVTGIEKLPQGTFLLVGNHRSGFDPILEMWAFRKWNVGFVAKQELFRIPIIGKLMHQSFCLSLNRENLRDSMKTIQEAAAIIVSDKASIGIYPEGTRSKDGTLLPFKSGAFKIAQKAKCPIVIAVIRGSENILKKPLLCRKDVYLDIIRVVGPEEVASHKTTELSNHIYRLIETALLSFEKECCNK